MRSGVVFALYLFASNGCVIVPDDPEHFATEPIFHDPIAMQSDDGPGMPNFLASLSKATLESIDTSLVNLMRGDRVANWDKWAHQNVQDGDIIFVQSRSNWIWWSIELSQLTQDVTDSLFTHVAIAAIEDGEIVLYDIDTPGPGRTRFGMMMANSQTAAVAIKRLRPEFQPYVPGALRYCRDVYASRVQFDKQLDLSNDRLYCAELIEVAFRSSGLELSQPTRWNSLPGLDKHPVAVWTIAWANETHPEAYVVVPGNDRIGIWASPGLELVLPYTDSKTPPEVTQSRDPQSP